MAAGARALGGGDNNNGVGKRKLDDASWSESGNGSGASRAVSSKGGGKNGKDGGRKRFNRPGKGGRKN